MPIKIKPAVQNGDVAGPSSSTDNAVVRFDGTSGKVIQNSLVIIEDTTGNIDRATASALVIGGTNATSTTIGKTASSINLVGNVINIGESGATINIIGSTTYEQVTNLDVADKLITINKGGSAASGNGTGLEIEENSSITGYIKSSSDRNSYSILAPNSAGIITLTPGATGFTIDETNASSISSSVTDNALVRMNGTTGKSIQTSSIIIDDSDSVTGVVDLTATGTIIGLNLQVEDYIHIDRKTAEYNMLILSDNCTAPSRLSTSMHNIFITPQLSNLALVGGDDNIVIGYNAGIGIVNGSSNIYIGSNSGQNAITGIGNVAMGPQAGQNITSAQFSTAIGFDAQRLNRTGYHNTSLGYNTLWNGIDKARRIAIGAYAGYYADEDDAFIVDNRVRANNAEEKTNSLMYGYIKAAPADNKLTLNAEFTLNGNFIYDSQTITGISTGAGDNDKLVTQGYVDDSVNAVTPIVNADVDAAAAIARSKLASGTADYVVINSGAGVMSEEQYLAKTRGGTGITSTATFPASGVVNTGTGSANKIAKFSGAGAVIADSTLTDSGSLITSTSDIMMNAQQEVRFGDADSNHYVGFRSPATVAADVIWDLPDADGSANNVLATNGSKVLSWVSNVGAASLSTKTSNYTITTNDNIIIADATSNDVTLTLPAASGNAGISYRIERKDSTVAYEVIIDGNSSETIDGVITRTLKGQYEAVDIVCDGSNWYSTATAYEPTAYLQDVQTVGTNGGTAAANYQTRVLNVLNEDGGFSNDGSSFVTLSSNQFTVWEGTYNITFSAPGYDVNGHTAILYDVTNSANLAEGTNEYTGASSGSTSTGQATVTVPAGTTLTMELGHSVQTAQATDGLGVTGNSTGRGYDIYSKVKITKVK